MEKTEKKRTKKRTLQITYPAPYSQSWNPDILPVLMKNNVGPSSSPFHRYRRPLQSSRAWSQQFPDRPDLPAPHHLKYGVFRNRRGPLLPKRIPPPDKEIKLNRKPSHVIKVPQDLLSKRKSTPAQKKTERKKICVHLMHCTLPPEAETISEAGGARSLKQAGGRPLPRRRTSGGVAGGEKQPVKRKTTAVAGNSRFPPVFVIRNIDKTNSRQLSKSKIMHMDIKPRRIASLSPSFCPSPTFRTARKHSPTRRYRIEHPEPLPARY